MIVFFRIIFIVMGAIAGWESGNNFIDAVSLTRSLSLQALIILSVITIFSGAGYVLGGIFGRAFLELLEAMEAKIQRYSGTDILFSVAGLIIGLLAAFFLSFALVLLPYGTWFVIGGFLTLGSAGLLIAFIKRDDLAVLFKMGRAKPGGRTSGSPKLVDTSAIIDGRIIDIAESGFIEGALIVPRFVLDELQLIADSSDSLRRQRGRRGLDILNNFTKKGGGSIEIMERDYKDISGVDAKLVRLAKDIDGTVITVDFNLNKVARLQDVKVMNVNELANAVKAIVLPGEEMSLRVVKEGKEANQGVGYLDDGTMVVIEEGKKLIGKDIGTIVTSVLQTPAGRMVFVKRKAAGKAK
jgi:uncharacterized protein YacL